MTPGYHLILHVMVQIQQQATADLRSNVLRRAYVIHNKFSTVICTLTWYPVKTAHKTATIKTAHTKRRGSKPRTIKIAPIKPAPIKPARRNRAGHCSTTVLLSFIRACMIAHIRLYV